MQAPGYTVVLSGPMTLCVCVCVCVCVYQAKGQGKERHQVVIDKENVQEKVAVVLQKQDLSKWII